MSTEISNQTEKSNELYTLLPAVKGGRCFNSAHRDSGQIVHAVKPMPENCGGYWGDKAACGTEPGRRGFGWTKSNNKINCPKCIKKLSVINGR